VVSGGIEADPPLPSPSGGERSRRQLLAGGGLLGAVLLTAGCTSKVKQASNLHFDRHTPGAAHDAAILNRLLRLEHQSIYGYTECIPLLPQPTPPPKHQHNAPPPKPPNPNEPLPPLQLKVPLAYAAAQQFLDQELSHVSELAHLVRQAGLRPVKTSPTYELGHPKTKQDILRLLYGTETQLLGGYLWALPRLKVRGLRGAATAIMANHAQHSTILRFELGLDPVPDPFLSARG
jgi:hypothetical protein